jgi:hypothetical protein
MPLTDAAVKTSYLGDSVYVSEVYHDPTTITVFLNNGERESSDFIARKNEIVLEPDVARALIKYIQERLS